MSFSYSFSNADYEKFKNDLFSKKTSTAQPAGRSPSVFPAANEETSKEGCLTSRILPYGGSKVSIIEYTNGENGFKNVKTTYEDGHIENSVMSADEFIERFSTSPFDIKYPHETHPFAEVSSGQAVPWYHVKRNPDVHYTEYTPGSGGAKVKTVYKDGHIENSMMTSEEFIQRFCTTHYIYAPSGAENHHTGAGFTEEQYQQFKKDLLG